MSNNRSGAVAATVALGFAAFVLGIVPAHAEPKGCPAAAIVDDSACFGRLTSVTAKDFSITGTLGGGDAPITLSGQSEAYLKSTGFANTTPDLVQQWDVAIDRVNNLDPSDPNWYANGKSRAFLPVQLNQLASQFPPETIEVRFVPDESHPGQFRLLSIQPTG
jgi:hypothetical protein